MRLLVRSILKGYEDDFQASSSHPVAEYYEGFCGLPAGTRIIITSSSGLSGFGGWTGGAGDPVEGMPSVRDPGTPGRSGFTGFTGNTIHTGILGSDYRFTNDGVEIYVPEGSVYTLEFHGMDQEYLNIKFQLMSEGGVIKTYIFADLTLDIDGCGEVTFDLTGAMTDPVLRLDNKCDGVYEEENIPPSYVLDEEESNDFIAPATTANITGTMGDSDWYVSDVSISLPATDNDGGSGILATRYRFQTEGAFTNYSSPIQVAEPGNHTLTYYSIDRNLNKETEKVLEFKIDNVAPQIPSVTDEGYFSVGTASLSAI